MKNLKFSDLNLSKEIQKAITDMGFEEATPIQSQSIPILLEGKDVIGQAQTGTGKTAAFGIPIIETINLEIRNPQALVLCPTRELAIQITEELKELLKYKKGIEILAVYGGQPIDRQIKSLKKGVHIIIGTPGRVLDHIRSQTLRLDAVKKVVLDEADEMLDMGFREDIEIILAKTPSQKQTIFFSATIPKLVLSLAHKFQKNSVIVKIEHKALTVPNIEQFYFEVNEKIKPEILSRLIDLHNLKLALVFCNTKKRVDELVGHLQARGYLADGLHGDLKQMQRDRVMAKFRKGLIEILVATDVAARGIDVEHVEAVINYDVPQDEENYVHRIGRTGRAGRTGKAFSFVVGRDIYKIRDIQRYTKAKIIIQQVPSISDVEAIKTNLILEKIKTTIKEGHLGKYVHSIETLIAEEYTSLDAAAALFKIFIDSQNKEVAEVDIKKESKENNKYNMVKLFINIGKNQKIQPKDIVGSIAGETGISGKLIGHIEILEKFTFVEVPKENANEIINKMNNNQIRGNIIKIELANKRADNKYQGRRS